MTQPVTSRPDNAIAVIGMSGRWPGARTPSELWNNIRNGVESISRFTPDDMAGDGAVSDAGSDRRAARSILEDVDQFDAAFFGILPREAELMDPQHRVFLECSWNALADGGYDPHTFPGSIGVFAGCSTNTYFLNNICQNRQFLRDYVGNYPLGNSPTMLGAIADTLATRVSYKLNLRGPSLTIQTACSTSLVAVCQACQSLLTFQCDMALAGGVSITFPQKRGYSYHEGGMGSADGTCRPFDAEARGTVFGSGAGVVLLKRLEDALAAKDPIYAIIRGFAVNNDGSTKAGFTAPGIEGQANVIAMAHALADIDPQSITYLEAHGTATPLGDPIEVAALTRAFRLKTPARNFCALGSVKANVGHLEVAAGITGLISAIQALAHKQLPPLLGFKVPNPNLDLPNSPFYINRTLSAWEAGNTPRRAGVSSFGVGGTNAHVVIEEAPPGLDAPRPQQNHPFVRKRYWIDEPELSSSPVPMVPLPGSPTQIQMQRSPMMASQDHVDIIPTINGPDRPSRLRQELLGIFQDLSGLSLTQADCSVTFVELGFDSLSLTQITQVVQKRFGTKLTFRQLLDQESTIDKLAAYLDARLPAEPIAPVPPVPAQISSPPQAPAQAQAINPPPAQTAVESILREQLQVMSQLMAQQLTLLRGQTISDSHPGALAIAPTSQEPLQSPPIPLGPGPAATNKTFCPHRPLQRGSITLNETQTRALATLIHRYTKRTLRSKDFTQNRRPVLADPRVVSGFRSQWKEIVYPIVTVRSQGCRLWDLDGNEYIDILNGYGPIFFGHSPSFVTDALAAQLQSGFELGPQTRLAGDVADLISELTGNERVTFCNTGSEAVMAALRLARTVTGRSRIVLFAGAYHGNFDEVLVKKVSRDGKSSTLPAAPGIPNENVANVTVLHYGTPESLEYIRQHASDLAAILVEPVQSRHPALRPIEFLREIRMITEASGTALIFDEIVTGFRCHPGGIQALFGIRADLAVYGKIAGGGMPIGIIAGRSRFMDALDGGMWQYGDDSHPETGVTFFAGTFVRHPLSLTASYAVLKRIKEEGPTLQKALAEKTTNLVNQVNDSFKANGVPADIEHFASWFYFSFPTDAPFGSLLYYYLRERGIHIQEGFPCFITTAHSEADLDAIVRAFRDSITEMRSAGFWPDPNPASIALPAPTQPPPASFPAEVPLTESQVEILLSARLGDAASCAFNEAFTLEMRGRLDLRALQNALQTLLDRHDCLRSRIDIQRNLLLTTARLSLALQRIDHSTNPPSDRAYLLENLVHEDAAKAFDLERGPLIRMKLVKWNDDLHTLLITSHHIVCDGWSTRVLLEELSRLYSSYHAGQGSSLAPPPSFRHYALTEASQKQSATQAATAAWWAEQFAEPVDRLELPTDRPRGSLKSSLGSTVRRTIHASLHQRLKRAGAQQGSTMFVTMLTGFAVLLNRLTSQNDIVVGVPTAGQSTVAEQALVGHCVNFLPLRTAVTGNQSIADLLKRVSRVLMDALDHSNYTYGSLVRKLGLPRDPGRLPLVEVQFNLEQIGSGLSLSGLTTRFDACPKRFVNFDLFLNVMETNDGLILDCDFNRHLFDSTTIERWLRHLETILEGIASDTSQRVAMVPLLDTEHRQYLREKCNDTLQDYPRDLTVPELITMQVTRTPDAIAVVCADQKLTYAHLERAANRIAHFLIRHEVRKGDRVAICLERGANMLLAVLGVLKAGAAYVPLDPQCPLERTKAILEDIKPTLILTQLSVAFELGLNDSRAVNLDTHMSAIMQEKDCKPGIATAGLDLAYVIYTSGSTGKPKGVQIPHRAVVNFLCSMAREPGFTNADSLLAITTVAFDISVLELFLPLTVGGQVIIATPETSQDGKRLSAMLADSAATMMQATPATWRLLLDSGWRGSPGLTVLCGGEALTRDLANELLARSRAVWNMYGPTETTVWSSASRVGPGQTPVTIGPPIANTQFLVLDYHGQPQPIGVAGELHIGGDGLSLGYWNRPELTAAKFIADPVRPEKYWYRTGDLVRYLADGSLEFLGRLDNQVKINGFRIEIGEVESILKLHPEVRDAVVVAREDSPGHKRLVAYVVLEEPETPSVDLRGFLALKLPRYMIPSLFIPIATVPLTPNGKIDRNGLPRPDFSGSGRNPHPYPPRTNQERILAGIIMDVLQSKNINLDDSIFDLGADSIQVFQIVARANEAGLMVTPRQLLAGRSIASICAELDISSEVADANAEPKLAPVQRNRFRMKRSHIPGADNSNGKH